MMRIHTLLAVALALLTTARAAPAQATKPSHLAEEKNWEFSLSALTYFVPNDREYVQPTVTADHGFLHLEARYNYEDLDTGSLWVGCNFSFGDEITLDVTPMIGGVFGDTTGVAPGYEVTLSWRKLELYSEGEYLFDANDSSDSFFYTWSELTVAPLDWLRVGLVIERTKAFDTDFDIQHGLLVGVHYKNMSLTTYVFNPEDEPVVVLGVGVDF